ncbi:TIGR01777 family oxidoreductase [bacterium]|jgi:uncharacterized protein (TIGR01777 family)|nr:TIGR01777 family oxidoreductase [bacterium]
MKILMTGATGFIGSKLGQRLVADGHSLVVLTRDPESARKKLPFAYRAYAWNSEVEAPREAFDGVEAIVHLAGESLAEGHWTPSRKKSILESRTHGTRNLLEAVGLASEAKPQVIIGASAIGYYGDRGDEVLTEASAPGKGFAAEVCQLWEAEMSSSHLEQVRKVIFRFGMVLGKDQGALAKMVPLFRKGLGGPIAEGKQWMSWIHIDDLVQLLVTALTDRTYSGIYNAVVPKAVTNEEFSRALGDTFGKKAPLRVPAFALKLVLGEMASIVLGSQKVVPERLIQKGFRFRLTDLRGALKSLYPQEKG